MNMTDITLVCKSGGEGSDLNAEDLMFNYYSGDPDYKAVKVHGMEDAEEYMIQCSVKEKPQFVAIFTIRHK